MGWNTFFHSRMGPDGLKMVGWLRIFYALLIIADRLCFAMDLEFLLSPTKGVVNYRLGQLAPGLTKLMWSLFALAPDSEAFLWGLHYLGALQALLLLLGIAPRFQLACLFVNMVSFQHHNLMVWDAEDHMFKIWYVE